MVGAVQALVAPGSRSETHVLAGDRRRGRSAGALFPGLLRARSLPRPQPPGRGASFGGHFVYFDAPGLAYETIRVALSALRAGGTLPKCADTVLPKIGAHCTTP
jgi:hypothetical protein